MTRAIVPSNPEPPIVRLHPLAPREGEDREALTLFAIWYLLERDAAISPDLAALADRWDWANRAADLDLEIAQPDPVDPREKVRATMLGLVDLAHSSVRKMTVADRTSQSPVMNLRDAIAALAFMRGDTAIQDGGRGNVDLGSCTTEEISILQRARAIMLAHSR